MIIQKPLNGPNDMENCLLRFALPKFIGWKDISFYETYMNYGRIRIDYKNLTGISFSSTAHSTRITVIPLLVSLPVYASHNYNLFLCDYTRCVEIKFDAGIFKLEKGEKDTLFLKLIWVVDNVLKPYLLVNLSAHIRETGSLKVGNLILTKDGMSKRIFLLGEEFLPWNEYGYSSIRDGKVVIFKREKLPGSKWRPPCDDQFYEMPVNTMNAIVLPELVNYLKDSEIIY